MQELPGNNVSYVENSVSISFVIFLFFIYILFVAYCVFLSRYRSLFVLKVFQNTGRNRRKNVVSTFQFLRIPPTISILIS